MFLQADSYGEDVRGFVEYSGVTVINETSMVGVQKSKTTLSQITSDKLNTNIQVRNYQNHGNCQSTSHAVSSARSSEAAASWMAGPM
jgi:hypothetical protein